MERPEGVRIFVFGAGRLGRDALRRLADYGTRIDLIPLSGGPGDEDLGRLGEAPDLVFLAFGRQEEGAARRVGEAARQRGGLVVAAADSAPEADGGTWDAMFRVPDGAGEAAADLFRSFLDGLFSPLCGFDILTLRCLLRDAGEVAWARLSPHAAGGLAGSLREALADDPRYALEDFTGAGALALAFTPRGGASFEDETRALRGLEGFLAREGFDGNVRCILGGDGKGRGAVDRVTVFAVRRRPRAGESPAGGCHER